MFFVFPSLCFKRLGLRGPLLGCREEALWENNATIYLASNQQVSSCVGQVKFCLLPPHPSFLFQQPLGAMKAWCWGVGHGMMVLPSGTATDKSRIFPTEEIWVVARGVIVYLGVFWSGLSWFFHRLTFLGGTGSLSNLCFQQH